MVLNSRPNSGIRAQSPTLHIQVRTSPQQLLVPQPNDMLDPADKPSPIPAAPVTEATQSAKLPALPTKMYETKGLHTCSVKLPWQLPEGLEVTPRSASALHGSFTSGKGKRPTSAPLMPKRELTPRRDGSRLADSPRRISNPVAAARWRAAIKKVTQGIHFSQALHTLRDMSENTLISPDQLRFLKSLGNGAFAKVELCEYVPSEESAGMLVAVKRLKAAVVMNSRDQETFKQEISLLRKLRCSHIVDFIGVGYTDAQHKLETMFLVQEYMNKGSLRTLLGDQMQTGRKLFSYVDALRWSIQLAKGLAYLHEAKPMIIHRDLKQENILMQCPGKDMSQMTAKLADFGLVALIKRPKETLEPIHDNSRLRIGRTRSTEVVQGSISPTRSINLAQALTAADSQSIQDTWSDRTVRRASAATKLRGSVVQMYELSGMTGSLMYMAPEVFKELPYNQKVDVFSFGVVIFELFSRYMMLAAISMRGTPEELEQYAARVSQGYRPPFGTQIPAPLQILISRCWAQEPELRPNMSEVVKQLQQIQQDGIAEQWDLAEAANIGCSDCTIC